jgi:YD repeat-containing protein
VIKIKATIVASIVFLLLIWMALPAQAANYTYDDLNRLIEVEYETGQKVTYTYDAAGNILSIEVNIPLQLENIGDKQVDAGQLLEFTVQATGVDGGELSYSVSNLPEGASFDAATRTFSWTPAYSQAGDYSGIRFEVSAGSAVVYEEITITVNSVNTAPGTDIEVVDEASGLTFTFDNIEQCGNTVVTVHDTLPEGEFLNISFLPFYYDISTTAEFSGLVRIKVNYDVTGYDIDADNIRLFHFKNGEVVDITDPIAPGPGGNPDTEAGTVEGVTSGFSVFALGVVNDPIHIKVGEDPVQLNTFFPMGTEVSWSSSEPEVAAVSADGMVIPLSLGHSVITVTTVDGSYSTSFDVVVCPFVYWMPPIGDQGSIDINSNQTVPVKFHLTDEHNVNLSLNNIEVQVWSKDGKVLMGKYSLTGSGSWKLGLNPQGIYHANISAKSLNLQPNLTYKIVVTMDKYEIDSIDVTVKK